MADGIGRFRRDQPVAVEARRDDGDVVGPSHVVRAVDQPLARRHEIWFVGHDARDLVRLHLTAQPVAAQHEHVAATELLAGEIDLDLRLGAECLEDDVAPLAQLGLLLRQLSRLDEPLHQRLILRDLLRHAVAHEIRAAVAHLREVDRVAEHAGDRRGRPHAAELRMLDGEHVDLARSRPTSRA